MSDHVQSKAPGGAGWKKRLGAVVVALSVAACVTEDKSGQGTIGYVEGFLGGVAVDEPRAALVGRDILSSGGTAADAATAVYFTLAVTMPSSASLAGGGVCLVHDSAGEKTEVLDFLSVPSKAAADGADRPSAVPGAPRGIFALHSRYGELRWESLVSPAEQLARFGTQVSRAFSAELRKVGTALIGDRDSARVFSKRDGLGVITEGGFMTQVDLSTTLGQLRRQGPGDFYTGAFARRFVAAVEQAGGTLSLEDLRDYAPKWGTPIAVKFGNETAYFAPPPAAAGGLAAQAFAALTDDDLWQDTPPAERPHLMAEVLQRAFGQRSGWMNPDGSSKVAPSQLVAPQRIDAMMAGYGTARHAPSPNGVAERPENPAATSFVVVDRDSNAVACTVTMNNLFGTGRIAPGTGILLAASPDHSGRGATALGPMMVIKHHVNEFTFAGAATGGVTAPSAMLQVAARTLLGGEQLEAALAAKRVHHGGTPDFTYFEAGLDQGVVATLKAKGHDTGATPVIGKVNAISCPDGIPPNPETCVSLTDPRGFGLAASADR